MVAQPLAHSFQFDHLYPKFQELNAGVLYITNGFYACLCNELAGQLLNVKAGIGQFSPMGEYLNPDREEYHIFSTMIETRKELRDTITTWEVDGRVRHVLIDSFLHRSADGQFLGMYVIIKDLGNFIALDQQMQRTDKLATAGKIAAGIAHEIRNPLTTIKGFLQILERRFESSGMKDELQFTDVMLREIDRVNNLVSEMLLLSKPHKVSMKVCSLYEIMQDISPLLQSEALLRGIDFDCNFEKDPIIYGDESMLKQVILNLAKNSFEAMDKTGNLRIRSLAKGKNAQIDVTDSGPGIPYYQIDRIFDAFFTTKEKGTGLGLPICQRIVTEHGGEIRVSSKGFGCTFTVLIPLYTGGP